MKKKLVSLLAVLLTAMLLCGSAFAAGGRKLIADDAHIFDAGTVKLLESKARAISESYPFEIVIYFADDLGGKSAMAFADDYWDYNGYGYGETHDGILLLVCPQSRDYWISTCGAGIEMFDDSRLDVIADSVVDCLRYDDWQNAAFSFLSVCESYLAEGMPEKPSPFALLPFCIGGGFLGALIPTAVMKGKLKSVKQETNARNYVPEDGVRIFAHEDRLVNMFVTRRKIESESSGGSSTHVSSSGVSHGGRGGKF